MKNFLIWLLASIFVGIGASSLIAAGAEQEDAFAFFYLITSGFIQLPALFWYMERISKIMESQDSEGRKNEKI